ncbi:MAG TPA: hypothetical protein VJH37_00760 [Candidatus Nanoarchaeia archaeon]|nr:hypothetical protein [Candidatus Nanoarchaeia archaeon]
MKDIFETTMICEDCSQKTDKVITNKEGFQIRAWSCKDCQKLWPHPLDQQEYESFKLLQNKEFKVKLRLVGNSYTVSIPREIIDFEEEMQREMDDMIRMTLEGPEKLSLFFSGKLKRFMKDGFSR